MSINKIEILKRTNLFSELTTNELEKLSKLIIERTFLKNEIVFIAGEEAQGLFIIAQGSVRAVRTNFEGREQIIHIEYTGSVIADIPVFDGGKYPSTVMANENSHLLFINKFDIRQLCLDRPQIALNALAILSKKIRHCAELIEFLSLREVGQRIARIFILESQLRGKITESGIEINLSLTNQQIAAQVGSVREVVSRAITKLQKDQLIIIKNRLITIPDIDKLSVYADIYYS